MEHSENLIYLQSGVIPFRIEGNKIKIMLITTLRRKRWIIPKGLIEEDMTATGSAALEAFEEAGIKGKVYPDMVGGYEYQKWRGICKVEVFLMEVEDVLDDWPESSCRDRRWVDPEEAEQLVDEKILKKIFSDLPAHIGRVKGSVL